MEEKIPLLPSKLLFVINEEEIARQLTLVDFRIYQAIQVGVCLSDAPRAVPFDLSYSLSLSSSPLSYSTKRGTKPSTSIEPRMYWP